MFQTAEKDESVIWRIVFAHLERIVERVHARARVLPVIDTIAAAQQGELEKEIVEL